MIMATALNSRPLMRRIEPRRTPGSALPGSTRRASSSRKPIPLAASADFTASRTGATQISWDPKPSFSISSDAQSTIRLPGRLLRFGRRYRAPDAPLGRLHQVDDVLAARPLLRRNGFAGALLVDQIDERRFILVLELVGFEPSRLLIHDVLCQVQHVLRD